MKKNLGNTDRGIRILLAVTFTALYFGNVITGTLGLVLIGVSVILVLTSLVSFCPLYYLLGLRTRKQNGQVHQEPGATAK